MRRVTPICFRRFRPAVPLAAFAALVLAFQPTPAHALRVMTWNLLDYPDVNLANRQPAFRTVMGSINADVMIAQELHSQAGVDSFQLNVLNVVEPGQWANSGYFSLQTSPTPEGGAIFYKTAKVGISFTSTLTTGGPRQVLFTRVTPGGYTAIAGTFRMYSVHFKADGCTGTCDSSTRRIEATSLRNQLNNVPAGTNFLVGGDTNIYGAYEGAYIRLTESEADNDGQCFDLLSMPGSWHAISGYAPYDTQSPCATGCFTGQSGGGLDDRFDMLLASSSMRNGGGVDLQSAGYGAYGNDGQHFNTDVNGGGFNNAVGITVANALHLASDHLPVVAIVQVAAKIAAASTLDFGSVITGGTAQQTLNVTNSAVSPSDALTYSFATAPIGFTAPVGSSSIGAGVTLGSTITMDTGTTGVKSGTLTINTNAPDSLTKPVLLSGKVLAHAVASLDNGSVVTEDSLDFGPHASGGFTDGTKTIDDLGYNGLQARLSVGAATFTGPNASRFSITGGFTPLLVAGTGQPYAIHFDDTGAGPGSYTATLTFSTSDEPLPGAAPQSDLVIDLAATVSSNTGVPGPLPVVLAFARPRPNPLGDATTFGFDLPAAARVSLDVFDLDGRRLARVVAGEQPAGRHEVRWPAADDSGRRLDAGLYFARFTAGSFVRTERLVVLP